MQAEKFVSYNSFENIIGKFEETEEHPALMRNRLILKTRVIIIVWIGVLLINTGCRSNMETILQSEINAIAKKWVPDTREAICTISVKSGEKGRVILTGETTSLSAKQEIIKTLDNKNINLVDSILILPDTVRNKKFMGLVTLSVINLRKQPDQAAEMVSQSILGTPVLILKDEDSWLLIQTPDNYIAWTEKSSIRMGTSSEMAAWRRADRVIYLENTGWIYSSPNKSGIVGDLVAGCLMEKVGESDSYILVKLPDDRTGFVEKKALMEFNAFRNQNVPDKEVVIRIASSLLGVPYLWGGSSAKGFDCSGFVQRVFFINGLLLSRDASLQALHGDNIDLSKGLNQLQKGDLLFFGSKEGSKLHITHVAIYFGDNKYINSAGRVQINSLDSTDNNFNKYRLFSLLAARRVIDANSDPGIIPIKQHTWY